MNPMEQRGEKKVKAISSTYFYFLIFLCNNKNNNIELKSGRTSVEGLYHNAQLW